LIPKIGPHFHFRVEQIYFHAIRALALKHNKTVSEYLRDEVVEPFLQAKATEATQPEFAAATRAEFVRDVKEYVDLATGIPIAGGNGLPSDKRREDLEALVWKTLTDLNEFIQTEEAARNARASTNGMEVMRVALATVYLEILKYQDKATVGPSPQPWKYQNAGIR
jgi:hypothetical protein